MANIIINSWPLYGPVSCLLDLANRLKNNGHRIYFIGIADCEEMITPQGFEFIPVFERIFHKGILHQASKIRDNCNSLTDVYRAIVEQKQRFQEYFDFLTVDGNTEFKAIIDRVQADLFMIEGSTETSSVWALLGYKNNLKSIYVNTILPFRNEGGQPPLDSDIIPDGRLITRMETYFSWARFYLSRTFRHYFFDANWNKHIRVLAAAWDYPQQLVDTTPFACPLIDIPELCTTPEFLNFPHTSKNAQRQTAYYVESHQDRANDFPDPPWENIRKGAKLIYCSLGSHYINVHEKKRFYEAVMAAVKDCQHWHLILSTGNTLTADDFNYIPDNVTPMPMVSQKNVLKRADVMITHGGINSVKECIFFAVPMLVYPFQFDQPGDAARVQYHNIGVRQDFRKATAETIQQSLRHLLDSEEIRANIENMSSMYKPELDTGVQWIENLMCQ